MEISITLNSVLEKGLLNKVFTRRLRPGHQRAPFRKPATKKWYRFPVFILKKQQQQRYFLHPFYYVLPVTGERDKLISR